MVKSMFLNPIKLFLVMFFLNSLVMAEGPYSEELFNSIEETNSSESSISLSLFEQNRGKISEEIRSLDVGFGFDFFDISKTGFGASLGYKYAVRPTYEKASFSRFDKYPGQIHVNPIPWIWDDSKLGVTVSASSELQFARQFKSQKEAFTAKPYSPSKAPTNSKKVIEKLNEGDYSSLIHRLSIYIGAGSSWEDVIKISASVGYTISAQYGVQVFKLKNNHIRLKLFAERSKGPGFHIGAEAKKDDFDIFGTDYINDAIERLIKLELLDVSSSSRKRDVYLEDFVVNLNDKDSRKAFDKVMKRMISIKESKFRLLNPYLTNEEIIKYLRGLTRGLNVIFEEDTERQPQVKRVVRLFSGKDIVPLAVSRGFSLGNSLLSIFSRKQDFENQLTYKTKGNEAERYTLSDSVSNSGFRALFNFFEETKTRSINVILERDEDEKIKSLATIGFSLEVKDKRMRANEFKRMKSRICNGLGEEICRKVNWSEYEGKSIEGFRMRVQYLLGSEAYGELTLLNKDDYRRSIRRTIEQYGESELSSVAHGDWDCVVYGQNGEMCEALAFYLDDVEEITEKLYETFHSQNPEEAYRAFSDLRWNSVFSTLGGPILMNMLSPNSRGQFVATVFEMSGANKRPVEVILAGDLTPEELNKKRKLYDYTRSIQTTIFNRGFDLRFQNVNEENLIHLNP